MKRLNKKGFTLVELLAVIVILALIMAIAIYSISGILQNSREGVFKDTALSIIHGVKNQLLAINQQADGTYYFDSKLLENDNDLPFGGKIKYGITSSTSGGVTTYKAGDVTVTPVGSSGGNTPLYKGSKVQLNTACTKSAKASFINVDETDGKYSYSICLIPTATNENARFIKGTEAQLMGSTEQTIFTME